MKLSQSIKIILLTQGWKYTGSCNCGGMRTYKYELIDDRGEYKLHQRATSFLISKPGTRFKKFPISEIKNTVDEIVKFNTAKA